MKHCFILTSAINTRFGVYTAEQRLQQTLGTIGSIRAKVPTAKIVWVEMAGIPLTEEQSSIIVNSCDILLDFTDEPAVLSLYNGTDNWDVVKNGTEIMAFGAALKMLQSDGEFIGIDRVHKISGRYTINAMFDPLLYAQDNIVDKIVISSKRPSQFPRHITEQRAQYMSRLWSWPASILCEIIEFYDAAMDDFSTTVNAGLYIDIEHLLCKLLPSSSIHECENIGIEGNIGPNGTKVND